MFYSLYQFILHLNIFIIGVLFRAIIVNRWCCRWIWQWWWIYYTWYPCDVFN